MRAYTETEAIRADREADESSHILATLTPGAGVEVEIADYDWSQPDGEPLTSTWYPGVVIGVRADTWDRLPRIDVMARGRRWDSCSPACVRRAQ